MGLFRVLAASRLNELNLLNPSSLLIWRLLVCHLSNSYEHKRETRKTLRNGNESWKYNRECRCCCKIKWFKYVSYATMCDSSKWNIQNDKYSNILLQSVDISSWLHVNIWWEENCYVRSTERRGEKNYYITDIHLGCPLFLNPIQHIFRTEFTFTHSKFMTQFKQGIAWKWMRQQQKMNAND